MMRSRSRQAGAEITPPLRSARRGAAGAIWLGAIALAVCVAAAYLRDEPPRAARPSLPAAGASERKPQRAAPSIRRLPPAPHPRAANADTDGAEEQAQPAADQGWRALGLEPLPAEAMPTGYDTGSVITPASVRVTEIKPDDLVPEHPPESHADHVDSLITDPTGREPAPALHDARPSPPRPQPGHRGVDTGIVLTPAPPPDERK